MFSNSFKTSQLSRQPSRPFQHHDPLVLVLVVPKVFGRSVAVRNDPFDTDVGGVEQRREKLIRQVRREIGERLLVVIFPQASPPRTTDQAQLSRTAIASANVSGVPSSKSRPP